MKRMIIARREVSDTTFQRKANAVFDYLQQVYDCYNCKLDFDGTWEAVIDGEFYSGTVNIASRIKTIISNIYDVLESEGASQDYPMAVENLKHPDNYVKWAKSQGLM